MIRNAAGSHNGCHNRIKDAACDSLHSLRTTQIQQATCDTIGSRPSGTRTSARATRSTTCSSRMGSRGCCGSHVVSHVPCCALYGAWLIRIRSAPISATPDVRQPPHSPHTHAQHTHARTRYAHGTDEVARAHAPHMCLGVVHAVNGVYMPTCKNRACAAAAASAAARTLPGAGLHGRLVQVLRRAANMVETVTFALTAETVGRAAPMGTADKACAQQPRATSTRGDRNRNRIHREASVQHVLAPTLCLIHVRHATLSEHSLCRGCCACCT